MDFQSLEKLTAEKYKKHASRTFNYGTAGFRTKADDLETVLFRMGVLAVVRSKAMKAHIGMMITASHNPACDNGVKIVDPRGEMMAVAWEEHATVLANAEDLQLVAAVQQLLQQENINQQQPAIVVVGRDTRPSSDVLHAAAVAGVRAVGGQVVECGVVTTPILHYRVVCANDGGSYGTPTNEGYSKKLADAFLKLQGTGGSQSRYSSGLQFDGANGVGGCQMSIMAPSLAAALTITQYNDGKGDGVLNYKCGADHVKTTQSWPGGVPATAGTRCVSVDGDADRVIYSFLDSNGAFHLLDGDRIATLIAGYLKQLLTRAQVSLKLGLIQTAYANGASTQYINGTLGVPVGCAKTGVKFLHHMALDYDIGVYFEANGHGTVLFSDAAKKSIREAAAAGNSVAERLCSVIDVINETVGDAISDMLLVEVILKEQDWSVEDWNKQYTDLPNRLVKVLVADRSVISTTNAERSCVTPAALQPAIDNLLRSTEFATANARAFCRPSGTEDVVRVYAEASTRELADSLSTKVSQLVFDHAGGVGARPK
uniref:Phosphoacetylglucosamine mutase n=1 Tax=Hirondellea gigas TaxID=1518452 RepID=A0A2P2I430_9CRUS